MTRKPTQQERVTRPCVMAYVSTRLVKLRPAYRRDIVDHPDIFVLSLTSNDVNYYLMNVYNDDQNSALRHLERIRDELPQFAYMGGDFNCHSREWDPECRLHGTVAISLLETAASMGLGLSEPTNPGYTFKSANPDLRPSVIDLVFVDIAETLRRRPFRDLDRQGRSDHVPLSCTVDLEYEEIEMHRQTLKPDKVVAFTGEIVKAIESLDLDEPLDTSEQIDDRAQALAEIFSKAWDNHSSKIHIVKQSKPWWNDDCTNTLAAYRDSKEPDDWKEFRKATKAAKRKFFDDKIEEVSESNKRPWDLMEWVQQRKNPPCEAIQYNGRPCTSMPSLWEALHGSYNAA